MDLRSGILTLVNEKLLKIFNLEIIKTNPKESIKFAKEYFGKRGIIAAEIGVFEGENALQINKNLNLKKFYLIDPYKKYENYKGDGYYDKLEKAKRKAHKRNFFKNNIWLEEYSQTAADKIKEELDFVYIDGNHQYVYVKKDLEVYWQKIKKGGIISGHDIQSEEVSRAIMEFSRKKKLQVYFGERRDWWIIK